MATASTTWAAWDTTHAWEVLADCAQSTPVVYAAVSNAAKFTCATKGTSGSEIARVGGTLTGTGASWQTIFGIAAGQVVSKVRLTAWTSQVTANTKLTSHTITIKLVADDGTMVTDAAIVNAFALNTTTDGSPVAQGATALVNVLAAYQASATNVRLSLEYAVVTATSASACSTGVAFDGVAVEITYAPAAVPAGGLAQATKTIIMGIG